jgi:two-component system LytT family response regulator
MSKIRTLIVDDMELARQRLKQALETDTDIEIIGECSNGEQAVAAIKGEKPDLVFLDVQMPELSGFGVVESVGVLNMPTVVFVTAYDQFALDAFEVEAIDYVMKPYDDERVARTVARAKRQINRPDSEKVREHLLSLLTTVEGKNRYLKRIAIKTANHTVLVSVEDIDWIGGAGNYLELHCGKEHYLLRERFHQLESKLNPDEFVRVHRSTIVNIDRIKRLHPLFNGDHLIILKDGTELNLSRTHHERLLTQIGR